MKNQDIQVGDKVTYKFINGTNNIYVELVTSTIRANCFNEAKDCEILKIERPKYEVIEEKKELLTEEEKDFLKELFKYYRTHFRDRV